MENVQFKNLSTKSKRNDRFYVTFLDIPENISNILGRQVTVITRPDISFSSFKTAHRRNTYSDIGKIELQPINITFKDDEQSITSMFLYAQVMRQLHANADILGRVGKSMNRKFGIRVDFMDAMDSITESYILGGCFITNIAHSEPTTGDDDNADISTTIEFDALDVKVFDQYISLVSKPASGASDEV